MFEVFGLVAWATVAEVGGFLAMIGTVFGLVAAIIVAVAEV